MFLYAGLASPEKASWAAGLALEERSWTAGAGVASEAGLGPRTYEKAVLEQ